MSGSREQHGSGPLGAGDRDAIVGALRDLAERVARLERQVQRLAGGGTDREDVVRVFEAWRDAIARRDPVRAKRLRLTPDRRRKIEARLRDGYSVDDLVRAVVGGATMPHVSDRGVPYDDLSLILRNADKVELNLRRFELVRQRGAQRSGDSFLARLEA